MLLVDKTVLLLNPVPFILTFPLGGLYVVVLLSKEAFS